MKQLTSYLTIGLIGSMMALSGCAEKSADQVADDTASVDTMLHADQVMSMAAEVASPDVYSLLHEDERVRILDMKLPAGVTDGMHSHPDEAVYFIKGSKVRIHLPDGESMEMDVPTERRSRTKRGLTRSRTLATRSFMPSSSSRRTAPVIQPV